MNLARISGALLLTYTLIGEHAGAQTSEPPVLREEMIVTGSPISDTGELLDLPYSVQSFTADEIEERTYTSIADFLDKQAAGVYINHAQNNPLQPDLRIRGFTASPLLGAPQGVVAYMNGVRLNEPFGDTVNWDLLAAPFIQRMTLLSGANAAYGLNALGGTILISTRTGFDSEQNRIQASTGSFDRTQASLASGDNNGRWGYYAAADTFREDGWRDFSESAAHNIYGALSLREESLSWDMYAFASDTELRGNGAAPEPLLRQDRAAVFTHPDITENTMRMLSSKLTFGLDGGGEFNATAFVRSNTTDSFNGDGTEFEECELNESLLCEDDSDEPVLDQFNNPVHLSFDAINNQSERTQQSWGATAEYRFPSVDFYRFQHAQVLGLDVYRGETDFSSQVEYARLQADRSTTRSGRFNPEDRTALDSTVSAYGLYWIDRIIASEKTDVMLSARYNHSQLRTSDRSGLRPALNSSHDFSSLNGGIGASYRANEHATLYGSIHQSSRTPTPVELACSHPEAPCTLPNTFLADPPLKDIVAHNFEFGLRNPASAGSAWRLATFWTEVQEDIIFQTTGGVSSNEGFFSNASDTRRVGFSANMQAGTDNFLWNIDYTWLKATFEEDFLVSSPNHPKAINGITAVAAGSQLPGLPRHNLNAGTEWQITPRWAWHVDGHWRSGVHLRGDESNMDDRTGSAKAVNTQVTYTTPLDAEIYLAVNNIFDWEYETFGLYGEPDEVLPELDSSNNRFLSPSAPRGAWIGIRYTW
jgi:iron complex outermembrane receptor protein